MLGLINVVEMFVRSKPLKANFEPKAEQYRILLLQEYEKEHLAVDRCIIIKIILFMIHNALTYTTITAHSILIEQK